MSSGSERGPGSVWPAMAPLLLPFAVLFLGGLTLTVAQSLGMLLPVPWPGRWYDGYVEALRPHFLGSAAFSAWVALASAAISTALGAVLAWVIRNLPGGLQRPAVVYKVPLILPHIAVAFLVLVFWAKSGWVASLAAWSGLIEAPGEFPDLLYGPLGGGMILAYVYKETPFVIILALGVLRRLDPRLADTARMFGAGEWQVFRKVALPHMRRVLRIAFIILFLYTFGAFDIPYLLGSSRPGMLAVEVFNLYFKRDLLHRPCAMALLTLMLAFCIGFIVLYVRLAAHLEARERKL